MASSPDLSALRQALPRLTPAAAPALAAALGISVPTLHRQLQALPPGELLTAGRARRTRHALRRPLRGSIGDLNVYSVDTAGQAHPAGRLALLRPQGSWLALEGTDWPIPAESRDGWWPGLPYPLADMRPQGYMGRLFARAEHLALGVSPDPREWGDDDVVHVLAQRGADASGNLIVGDTALRHWQAARLALPAPLDGAACGDAYAALATQAVATGVPGSSAAGEFPKFSARRAQDGSNTPHVLVKFSGADDSPTVRRWSDLLACEHLALGCVGCLPGVAGARSRLLHAHGRTFLEVERFDRHGEHGRSPLCTLETINAALLGMPLTDWTAVAARLRQEGLLGDDDTAAVERLWWFGRLIANTDMHAGNLSLRPVAGRFQLAASYDMLPMLYAPLAGGEVPPREFEPALPLPAQRDAWHAAAAAAATFWQQAADAPAISPGFRVLCERNAARLRAATQHA